MSETELLLKKHQGRGAILDSNLLLVYAVGRCDRRMLRRSHHTKQYQEDFGWIARLVEWFARIHTTPNILTEVSNLGSSLGGKFFDELKKIISTLVETHWPSEKGSQDTKFRAVGLTDSAILAVATERKNVVLTADLDLYHILRARGADAINANHLRQMQWELKSTI